MKNIVIIESNAVPPENNNNNNGFACVYAQQLYLYMYYIYILCLYIYIQCQLNFADARFSIKIFFMFCCVENIVVGVKEVLQSDCNTLAHTHTHETKYTRIHMNICTYIVVRALRWRPLAFCKFIYCCAGIQNTVKLTPFPVAYIRTYSYIHMHVSGQLHQHLDLVCMDMCVHLEALLYFNIVEALVINAIF